MAKPVQLETSLSEFIYTIARESPVSLRRRLPEKYFRTTGSEKAAMTFAIKSTLEQKREFLSYLGIEHYFVFANIKKEKNDLRTIFEKFESKESRASTLQKLGESNAYISSNREFCNLLGTLSQVIDTPEYARNMQLIRSTYNIKKFNKKITKPEYGETLQDKVVEADFLKTILSILRVNDMCKEITELDAGTFRILLYLYCHKDKYFSQEHLKDAFYGAISPRTIGVSRMKLIAAGLIQKHPQTNRQEYTITGTGILTVNEFKNRVIKSFDF